MRSYHQVPLSASVSCPQLFGACPPVPSCTGTLVAVSPLDEAITTLHQEHQSHYLKKRHADSN